MLTGIRNRYGTAPSAGQRRAIAVNLVVFFVFALTAVVMLTRTAVAANSINGEVATAIEPSVGGINHQTRQLPALDRTARLTDRIARAARPLSGRLTGVVSATDRIDANLVATRTSVASIGRTVDGIRTSTNAIRPAVAVLDGHVDSIRGHAGDIDRSLGSVAIASSDMVRELSGTNASLSAILSLTSPLRVQVHRISTTVPEIRTHAARIADSPILLRNASALTTLLGNLLGGS